MLTSRELSTQIEAAQRSIFRLEALPDYNVTTADREVQRYLSGGEPDMPRKRRWLDTLRARVARGLDLRHVRVMRLPPSDYDRMACEWGYAFNVQAGLQVRVREVNWSDHQAWPARTADFYLLDDERVIAMRYTDDGQFEGGVVCDKASDLALYRERRDRLWSESAPFSDWWAKHPEFHRQVMSQ